LAARTPRGQLGEGGLGEDRDRAPVDRSRVGDGDGAVGGLLAQPLRGQRVDARDEDRCDGPDALDGLAGARPANATTVVGFSGPGIRRIADRWAGVRPWRSATESWGERRRSSRRPSARIRQVTA
jgi:hypothetical protein